jgi:hypothetical protein
MKSIIKWKSAQFSMKFWTKTSESFSSPYWIQSLSVYDFISDERKITTDIIQVRVYVAMFICKDLKT